MKDSTKALVTQISISTIGGVLVTALGGVDIALKALIFAVVLDYATGVLKAAYTKTLSSEIGYKGILKKVDIFLVVVLAVILDKLLGENFASSLGIPIDMPIRAVVIIFFVSNEALSILENVSATGLPIPKILTKILIQLRDKSDDTPEDKSTG